MKNKDKFVKIANIISKVLIGIMIALLVLCVGVVCFRACSADKQVAYASEADGIGIWLWRSTVVLAPFPSAYEVNFLSGSALSENFTGISFGASFITYISADGSSFEAYSGSRWVDGYRKIDITSAPPSSVLQLLNGNADYQGGTTPTTFTVTKQAVDCSIIGADTVDVGQSYTYQIAPNTGYNYPDTVSVLGADYSYDKSTGKITISDITGDVTINVRALAKSFNVSFNVSNATVSGPTVVQAGGPYVYQITPNAGYNYPDTVNVVGATVQDYSNTTGRLEIFSPSADVTISGVSPLVINPTDSIRGQYTFLNTLDFSIFNADPTFSLDVPVNFTTTNNGVVTSWNSFGISIASNNSRINYGRDSSSGRFAYSSTAVGGLVVGWQSPQFQVVDFGDEYQTVPGNFYAWIVANTVPQDVQNSEAYQLGYNAGLTAGQNIGYTAGYNAGDLAGYNRGYEAGRASLGDGVLGGAEGVIAGTASLFDIPIFGSFSMLDMLLVVFGIGVAIWFLKMFAGG